MGKNVRYVPQGRGKKPLDMVQERLEAEFDAKQRFQTDFLLQAGADAFLLAAADMFKLGKGRAAAAMETYKTRLMELMDRLIEDGDENGLEYYWQTLDARLRQIVGDENFVPHDQRYDETGRRIFLELFKRTVRKELERIGDRMDSEAKPENG
jgi:hypothetical protein